MDTPSNQTSYTAQTIRISRRASLTDVLANDPSIRSTQPRAYGFDFGVDPRFRRAGFGLRINGCMASLGFSFSLAGHRRASSAEGAGACSTACRRGAVSVAASISSPSVPVKSRSPSSPTLRIAWPVRHASTSASATGETNEFGSAQRAYRNGDNRVRQPAPGIGTAALGLDYRGERVRRRPTLHERMISCHDAVRGARSGLDDRAKAAESAPRTLRRAGAIGTAREIRACAGEVDLTDI